MQRDSRQNMRKATMTFTQPGSTPSVRSADYVSTIETIEGYRGKRANSTNPCYHVKQTVACESVSEHYGTTKYQGQWPISLVADGASPIYLRGLSTLDYQMTLTELQAVMDRITGSIEPIVSVPNLLIELPQTLSLWNALAKPIRRALTGATWRNRAHATAESWLATCFGAAPLISDVEKLIRSKRSVHSELRRLTAVPRSWESASCTLSPKALAPLDVSFGFYTGRGWFDPATIFMRDQSSVSQVRLTYDRRSIRAIMNDAGTAAAMAAALHGWDRPLDVLWEATAYSFVFDWFFPVGEYLHGLNSSFFAGCIQVDNLCTHVKSRRTATIVGSLIGSRYVPINEMPVVATATAQVYRRYVGIPASSSPLELTTPGIHQTILGGCLILQRHPP